MRELMSLRVLQFFFCVFILMAPYRADAFEAYNHNATVGTSNPNWMSRLKASARLRELSIPGTHDSVSLHGDLNTITQTLTLPRQLNAGIRFLDIRLKCVDDELKGYHGGTSQDITFAQILESIENFLSANPQEVVFARIKNEAGTFAKDQPCKSSTGRFRDKSFYDAFDSYYQSRNVFWKSASAYKEDIGQGQYNPPLSAMRGKLVLFPEFPNAQGVTTANFGIPFDTTPSSTPHFRLQDNWDLTNQWMLHDHKWEPVKRHLIGAREQSNTSMRDRWIYFNFLSANTGNFPYFFASGKMSTGNSAARLSTGVVRCVNDTRIYPDFPRASCVSALSCGKSKSSQRRCTILYEGVNELTRAWLNDSKNYTNYAGFVIMDFPGADLIKNIIGINDHTLLP